MDVGSNVGFLGRSGQADLGGTLEAIEDVRSSRVFLRCRHDPAALQRIRNVGGTAEQSEQR